LPDEAAVEQADGRVIAGVAAAATTAALIARWRRNCARNFALFFDRQDSFEISQGLKVKREQLAQQNPDRFRRQAQEWGADIAFENTTPIAYEPTGDYFDLARLPDGRISGIMGDVEGHGMKAGRGSIQVRNTLATPEYLSLRDTSPGAPFVETFAESGLIPSNLMAFSQTVYDPKTGIVEFTNAGIPWALIRRADGRVEVVHNDSLYILKWPGIRYTDGGGGEIRTVKAQLRSGDTLLVFSDGVLEGKFKRSGRQFQNIEAVLKKDPKALEREIPALRAARTAAEFAAALKDGVQSFDDDLTVMAIRQP
jgi:serine phosphatase RsbU (regulator of sigma subunit)